MPNKSKTSETHNAQKNYLYNNKMWNENVPIGAYDHKK